MYVFIALNFAEPAVVRVKLNRSARTSQMFPSFAQEKVQNLDFGKEMREPRGSLRSSEYSNFATMAVKMIL